MKNRKGLAGLSAIVALLALAGGLSFAAAQKRDSVGYRDTIVVLPGETRDSVVSFGGDIDVQGKVRKSVLSFGGTITVSGEVGDAVVGIGARIMLKETAVVRGDLVGLGGSLEKEPGAQVTGDTVSFRTSELTSKIFGEGFKGIFSLSFWPIILFFKVANLVLWILLGLITASIYPKQVAVAAAEMRKAPWPTLGIGIAAHFLFVFAVLIAAVLCLVLIGIPIVIGLAIGGFLVKVFGRVAVFFLIGESLSHALGRGKATPIGAALLGALVVGLIGFVPFLGFLIVGVLSLMGWGTAFRTKFGTMENWFQRKALPPSAPAASSATTAPPAA
jgi:hypothetical protein